MSTRELEIPESRRADLDDYCHIAEEGGDHALCGSTNAHHRGETQFELAHPSSHCPVCGRPTCRTCLDIWRTYRRSGAWEGP